MPPARAWAPFDIGNTFAVATSRAGDSISDRGLVRARVSFLPLWVSRTRIQWYFIQVFSGAYTLISLFFTTDDRQLPNTSEPILPGTHSTSLLAQAHESLHGRLLHDVPHQQGHGHPPKVSDAKAQR
jgi:hypothetical protein